MKGSKVEGFIFRWKHKYSFKGEPHQYKIFTSNKVHHAYTISSSTYNTLQMNKIRYMLLYHASQAITILSSYNKNHEIKKEICINS